MLLFRTVRRIRTTRPTTSDPYYHISDTTMTIHGICFAQAHLWLRRTLHSSTHCSDHAHRQMA